MEGSNQYGCCQKEDYSYPVHSYSICYLSYTSFSCNKSSEIVKSEILKVNLFEINNIHYTI